MTKLLPKRSLWAVQDASGLVHAASVTRFFDDSSDRVNMLHVATACCPRITQKRNDTRDTWTGVNLPEVDIYVANESTEYQDVAVPRFTITKWNVHEVPTCFGCALAEGLP